jgi:cytochrome c-type biogenesis protein CcmE
VSPGIKLTIGTAVIVVATSYMAYVGASSSWKYYVTADECAARLSEFTGCRLRVSGGVAPGSLQIHADRSQAAFTLIGRDSSLPVICRGLLPDNFAEGAEVVVEGRIEADGVLHGDKVLTKCASKYAEQRPAGETPVGDPNDRESRP